MLSPLQLKETKFTEVSIRTVSGGDFAGDVQFNPTIFVGQNKDERNIWRIELKLKIDSAEQNRFAYDGIVAAVGIFEVTSDFEPENLEQMVAVNGASMIYGAIREMILTVTARSEKR